LLVQATLITRPDEIGCDTCLDQVSAYAEAQLAGLPTPEALRRVEEHLAICGECQEEFAALALALGHGAP
jgi:predicted anti-sigma-YlaC factor YlaD